MKVVQKDWGVQVWHENEVVMVMRAGTKTSVHRHNHHGTLVQCLSGECFVSKFDNEGKVLDEYHLTCGDFTALSAGAVHQIVAGTDATVYEQYIPSPTSRPEEDIERFPTFGGQ